MKLALALLLLFCCSARAASVVLAWNPSPSGNVVGYNVYYGTDHGIYTNMVKATGTTVTLTNLAYGRTYYASTTAYNIRGTESVFSNEVSFMPTPPIYMEVVVKSSDKINGIWIPFTAFVWTAKADMTQRFFMIDGIKIHK